MPKVIGINFRDNDFCNVAYGFMEGLKHTGIDIYDKAKVVKVWNACSEGLYRLWQNPFEHNHDEQPGHISKYLTIDEDDVYFDEEVDKYLASQFLNSEFLVVDCRNPHLGAYCYVA